MQRRGGSGQPAKGQSATRPKARNTPTAQVATAGLQEQLDRRTRERDEALEQQAATAEVLKVISRSTFDLPTVLNTLIESACCLCGADIGTIRFEEGDRYCLAATYGCPPEWHSHFAGYSGKPDKTSVFGQTIIKGATVHIPDVLEDSDFARPQAQKLMGLRAALGVPLVRDGHVFGVVNLFRTTPTAFTQKQIELAETFADQAVIAIENTRLFNELRHRTDDLSESLQQQTATADVLKVISRSSFDLRIVLRTLVESAAQSCEAQQAIVTQRGDDGLYRLAASFGFPDEFDEYMRQNPLGPGRATTTGRVALEGKMVHIPDVLADPEYAFPKGQQLGGYRSNLGVPLLRDGVPIGAFVLMRPVVKPFSDKQIELVETFADQAVIAIENVRLLNELRESLQQQTATADVLKVISRSTFDLQPVLDTLLTSAARLCQADHSFVFLREDDVYRCASGSGEIPEWIEYLKQQTIKPGRGTIAARTALEGRTVHIPDVLADPEYTFLEAQKRGGYRTALGVPLLREGAPIGLMVLTRPTVRPFDDNHIALVTTFADQAVIAIENVRLFESVEARTQELAKSLEELRTTQDRLVQTQKLALLGQLTAGIAHEIKNPLNFVNNFAGISAELIDELQDTLKGVSLEDRTRTEIDELTDTLKSNFDKVVHHGRRADAIVK
ncbi:MAG: GAF domain-containing protein, partial [Pseudolabrys sp.]